MEVINAENGLHIIVFLFVVTIIIMIEIDKRKADKLKKLYDLDLVGMYDDLERKISKLEKQLNKSKGIK